MNAKQPQFRARTALEIAAQVSEAQREVIGLERARNSARTALPEMLVSGDADAIAEGRALIQSTERALHVAGEALSALREAHHLAQTQEHQRGAAQSLREIEQHADQIVSAARAIDSALDAFGKQLHKLIAAMNAKDALLSGLGIIPDPWPLRATLFATVEMHLWLATDGRIGSKPTLDNAHQLKQSGRASVGRLAAEAAVVELRTIRGTLGLSETPPPQAA